MPGPCRQARDIRNSLTPLLYWAIIAMKGGSLVLYIEPVSRDGTAGPGAISLALLFTCTGHLSACVGQVGQPAVWALPWRDNRGPGCHARACTQMSAAMVWRVWRHVPGTAVPALLWDSWAGGCLETLLHAQSCLSAAPHQGRLLCQAPAGIRPREEHGPSGAIRLECCACTALSMHLLIKLGSKALLALLQDLHRAQC